MPTNAPPLLRERSYPKPKELFSECENPFVARSALGDDPGDGIYICSCGHENKLLLYKGAHPFGNVSCARCDQVPNLFSKVSSVMILIADTVLQFATALARPNPDDNEAPYGSLCPKCGLTHRAIILSASHATDGTNTLIVDFGDSDCKCGNRRDHSWDHFEINSPVSYHKDPISAYQGLSIRNAEIATGTISRRHSHINALPYTPLCAMGTSVHHIQPGRDHNVTKVLRVRKICKTWLRRWNTY